MIHQPLIKEKRLDSNLYHFRDYRNKRPFFKSPMKILIDAPYGDIFYMVNNVVYKDKQILALKKEQESLTIFLVEAKIEDGQLASIIKLSDEYLEEVVTLLEDII
jgi:hypothetical protein